MAQFNHAVTWLRKNWVLLPGVSVLAGRRRRPVRPPSGGCRRHWHANQVSLTCRIGWGEVWAVPSVLGRGDAQERLGRHRSWPTTATRPRPLHHLDRQPPRHLSGHPLQPHPEPARTARRRRAPSARNADEIAQLQLEDPRQHQLLRCCLRCQAWPHAGTASEVVTAHSAHSAFVVLSSGLPSSRKACG